MPDQHWVTGWHADGRSFLTTRPVVVVDGVYSESELWRVPIDGTPARSLGFKAPGMTYVAMSPDGQRLAYGSGPLITELWLLSPAAPR